MSRSRHTQITVTVALLLLAPTALSALSATSEEAEPLDAFVANDMVLILRATNPARLEMSSLEQKVPASDSATAAVKPVFPLLRLPDGEKIVEARGGQWLGNSIVVAIVTKNPNADDAFNYWYALMTPEKSWCLVRLKALCVMTKGRWSIRYMATPKRDNDDSLEIGFSRSEYLRAPTVIYRNDCVSRAADVGRFYKMTLASDEANALPRPKEEK